MENITGKIGADEKAIKRGRALRVFWMVLIGIFFAVIVLRFFNWMQGKDNFYGILSPLGMIFVGLTQISVTGNKPLRSILLIAAMALVIAGLVMAITG